MGSALPGNCGASQRLWGGAGAAHRTGRLLPGGGAVARVSIRRVSPAGGGGVAQGIADAVVAGTGACGANRRRAADDRSAGNIRCEGLAPGGVLRPSAGHRRNLHLHWEPLSMLDGIPPSWAATGRYLLEQSCSGLDVAEDLERPGCPGRPRNLKKFGVSTFLE